MPRRLRSLVLSVALAVTALAGCGPSATEKTAEVAPPQKPRNAADIARAIVNARVGVMVWGDRVRGHAVADKIRALDLLGPALEGTGVDPIRDVRAAYVAATGVTRDDLAVAIVQHLLPDEQVRTGLDALVLRSNGAWLDGGGVPAARVTVRGQTRVVAMVEPSFLAVLPEPLLSMAARFKGTGGFPDPEGPEAAVATAIDPSHSLSGTQAPPLPETLRVAVAKVRLAEDGGMDLALDAESTGPEQASADAAQITDTLDRATSVKLGFVKLRLFDPIVFRAEGSRVKGDRHLTPAEIDRLTTLAVSLLPR